MPHASAPRDHFHVHHQFHAVGHGTFLTGVVIADSKSISMRWAYDCGSRRLTRVRDVVDELPKWAHWPSGSQLDLLVISHFDDDHINGLEQLLNQHYVKHLALPYMSFRQRLAQAASLSGDESASASTAHFSLDPVGFLVARGFSERIGSILVIRGGGEGASDSPPAPPNPDGPSGRNGVSDTDRDRTQDVLEILMLEDPSADEALVQYRSGVGTIKLPIVLKMLSHTKPLAFSGIPVEFTFFNMSLLAPATTNRSKRPISVVQDEVQNILARNRLLDPTERPKRGWRDELKTCYSRHFGNSGAERNNISLCVMVRPMATNGTRPCRIFEKVQDVFGRMVGNISTYTEAQTLLLTGDLALDSDVIRAMHSHFHSWRWNALGVVQVPHHGSHHSWKYGNAACFPDPQFVHCVPTPPRGPHHPHGDVVHDLVGQTVHEATYEVPVVHSYHFRP